MNYQHPKNTKLRLEQESRKGKQLKHCIQDKRIVYLLKIEVSHLRRFMLLNTVQALVTRRGEFSILLKSIEDRNEWTLLLRDHHQLREENILVRYLLTSKDSIRVESD